MAQKAAVSNRPIGVRWRSSKVFIITVISIAIFTDNFLFSFIIPILPAVLENRIGLDPSRTQLLTSIILSMNALVSIVIGPFTGYLSDKSSSKNDLMMVSWVMNIVATVLLALSSTLAGLFIGRLIQTIAGSLIWMVGMAILGETIGDQHLAKSLGLVIFFLVGGLFCGPAVSGSLYDYTSYAVTWFSTLVVLLPGIILQSLIIGPFNFDMDSLHRKTTSEEEFLLPDPDYLSGTDDELSSNPPTPVLTYESISPSYEQASPPPNNQKAQEATTKEIWIIMLRKRRVVTALFADALFAIIIASFETTIPLHIKAIFHWQTLQAGLLFLLIQAPSLILIVPMGWLKDKVGMQYPVAVGFLLLAPPLWLLGLPGEDNSGATGPKVYIVALLAIGVFRTLLMGVGAVEVLRGANEVAAEHPGIFGPNGGYSRTFTLSNVTWKLAMFLGPLMSGGLTEWVGYYYLNVLLAILCIIMAGFTFFGLRK